MHALQTGIGCIFRPSPLAVAVVEICRQCRHMPISPTCMLIPSSIARALDVMMGLQARNLDQKMMACVVSDLERSSRTVITKGIDDSVGQAGMHDH